MGLFSKNPNERFYQGGKKHWVDIIKNTGSDDCLIWKQPEEDFNTNSKVVVMPGEVAIFIKEGNIKQVFEKGTYQLSTNNYPFISRLSNAFSGGISGFNCVVYFVRTAHSKEIRWGTSSPIQVRDKVWGIRTGIQARGTYKAYVKNPTLFLEKLIGSNVDYETEEGLNRYFINEFQSKIRTVISSGVNQLNTELIGIDEKTEEFSLILCSIMDEILSEYGMGCQSFSIVAMDIDTSKYDQIDAAQVQAVQTTKKAQGEASEMNILGAGWQQMQNVKIMRDIAQNPNVGPMETMGAGLGMGMVAGGAFGAMAGQMLQPNGAYSGMAGMQQQMPQEDPMEVLTKLKKMLDAGLIEQSEYDAKKAEILSRI